MCFWSDSSGYSGMGTGGASDAETPEERELQIIAVQHAMGRNGGPASARVAQAAVAAIVLAAWLAFGSAPAFASKGVVGFFGGAGTGAGQFSTTPRGAAVNQNGTLGAAGPGDVYVVDGGNNRVEQFTSSGTFVRAFGLSVGGAGVNVCTGPCSAGTASGASAALSAPQGVAVDRSTGIVYVTDQTNHRVDIYSAAGAFQGAFGWSVKDTVAAFEFCTTTCRAGITGGSAGEFGSTIGYPAVDPVTGNIVVADNANRRVDVFQPTVFNGTVTGVSFVRAYGLDVVSSGPDNNGTTNFEICKPADVCKAGNSGSGPGMFSGTAPTRVATGNDGSVYAVDNGNNRVQKFDPSGNPEAVFASAQLSGSPSPIEIAQDPASGHVYVVKPCNVAICPSAAVSNELHVLEFDAVGTLVDTHAANAGITGANGLAYGSTSGNIYLPSTLNGQGVFVLNSPPVPPTASIAPATNIAGRSATFNGSVNPTGLSTGYHFEYSTDEVNWAKVPAADVSVGGGKSDVPVSQDVTGLEADTLYYVRLVATKLWGGGSATSPETTFTTGDSAPVVSGTGATGVQDTFATLRATINPENAATTWHFDYGTDTSYGTSVPVPDGTLDAGPSDVGVFQHIVGLQPNTTYHFRIVAVNATGETDGPDTTFTTFPSGGAPALPNGRAYEMVTPPRVDWGGETPLQFGATSDGDHGALASFAVLDHASSLERNSRQVYRVSRTASGWTTQSAVPPPEANTTTDQGVGQVAMTGFTDSRDVLVKTAHNWDPADLDVGPTVNGTDLYRLDGDGTVHWMSNGALNATNSSTPAPRTLAYTPDGAHAVFTSQSPLVSPDDLRTVSGSSGLYDWADGTLRLVGVDSSGNLLSTGNVLFGSSNSQYNALSSDGSRIFLTTGANLLWARDNGQTTTEIPPPPSPANTSAIFEGATPDGSKVFFVTTAKLTPDDTDSGFDLYEYDFGSSTLTRISAGPNGNATNALARPAGVLVSDDGSRVYFETQGQLIQGQGTPGGFNLYLWDNGTTQFVASLAGALYSPQLTCSQARLTPDGRVLVFGTTARLDPDDTDSSQDIYRYDADTGTLTLASQGPTGGNGPFDAVFGRAAAPGDCAAPGNGDTLIHPSRVVSDDGRYVFFETSEGLVPKDTNGELDVYELDASDGRTYLISSGTSNLASNLLDASPSGSDVFFATFSRLVPEDDDSALAVYDARIGGGFPAAPPPVPPCQGDGCQGAASSLPNVAVPGSMTLFAPVAAPESSPVFPALHVGAISAAARRQFARGGRLSLLVTAPVPGTVVGAIRGKLTGRPRTLATASKEAHVPENVHLTFVLSAGARRWLAAGRRLPLTITVSESGARSQVAKLILSGSRRRARR
jgi:NHL repeat